MSLSRPTHPADIVDGLAARFTPLAELAALLLEADERGFRTDNLPPLSPDMARAIRAFAEDLADARRAVERYVAPCKGASDHTSPTMRGNK